MNPTRRSLCGLGLASVPLAALGPRLLPAARQTVERVDPLLAYLVEDTRRNCRLARRPGRERAQSVRGLGANLGVLTAYLHSRHPMAGIHYAIRQRLNNEGVDTVAQRARDAWPGLASALAREYQVPLPDVPEYRALTTAIENLQRYGCPRLGGMRGWFEREADRIEQTEGRAGATALVRQTPGSDFGPAGWNAGIGDPDQLSCWDLGVFVAALAVLEYFQPELVPVLSPIIVILGFVSAVACN